MRFKIDWAGLIVESKFIVFDLFYFVFEGNLPSTSPRGGLYLEVRFNGGFFALPVWGAYTWKGLFLEFYGKISQELGSFVCEFPLQLLESSRHTSTLPVTESVLFHFIASLVEKIPQFFRRVGDLSCFKRLGDRVIVVLQ